MCRASMLCVALGLAASCATVPPQSDPDAYAEFKELNDPAEPFNRAIHRFNQGVDMILIEPAAKVYRFLVPKPLRNMVTNILRNLDEPITFVHDILQGEPERATQTFGRFLTNSTIGVGGAFDVAREFGLERHREDFGQTLAVWGVGEGPYLVLPLLGPSTLRDGIGDGMDLFIHPTAIMIDKADEKGLALGRIGMTAIAARERNMDTLEELEASSIDFYATMRSAYRQNRRKEVRNGAPPEQEENDIFDDYDWDDEDGDDEGGGDHDLEDADLDAGSAKARRDGRVLRLVRTF